MIVKIFEFFLESMDIKYSDQWLVGAHTQGLLKE
jgi:hypothetical protein